MEETLKDIKKHKQLKLKTYCNTIDLQLLHKLKRYLDDKYYNDGLQIIEDSKYDILKESIEERDPSWKPTIGSKIRDGDNKAVLPFWLGSMDKIKEEESDKIEKWVIQNKSPNYFISSKLDGVSCLATFTSDNIKLYTRGDGKIGSDISYFSQYIDTIPKNLKKDIVVRGELLIPEKLFQKKYSKIYQNPRNMISGLIGSKTLKEGISDIRFVAYEIVGSGKMQSPENQFEELTELGFETAQYKISNTIDTVILADILLKFKKTSNYELDGIIIQSNLPYTRNKKDNPKYAFAFKIQGESANTKVIEVSWNISKWGALKPTILIEPVRLSGVTISKATGNNAKFIMENKIGPGAIVTIIRSGDVIPKIIDVVVPASHGQIPSVPHKWNETNVDFIAIIDTEDNEMCIQRITSFFEKLDIKHIGKARVRKIYDAGIDSIIKIIQSTEKNLIEALDSHPMGTKIYKNIREQLTGVKTYDLLGSTGVFGEGIGQTKLKSLFESIPNLLELGSTLDKVELKDRILKVKGYSDISADLIVNNINWAIKFMDVIKKHVTTTLIETPIIKKANDLDGEIFVISGFRDKDGKLKSDIESRGGKLLESWRANATGVIIGKRAVGNPTGKVKQALDKGIPVYTLDEFKDKFIS